MSLALTWLDLIITTLVRPMRLLLRSCHLVRTFHIDLQIPVLRPLRFNVGVLFKLHDPGGVLRGEKFVFADKLSIQDVILVERVR